VHKWPVSETDGSVREVEGPSNDGQRVPTSITADVAPPPLGMGTELGTPSRVILNSSEEVFLPLRIDFFPKGNGL
jgi:hypothetical protein